MKLFERPIQLYPSLIEPLGLEAALLLSACIDHRHYCGGDTDCFSQSLESWYGKFPFWSREKLEQLQQQLVREGIISISRQQANVIQIRLHEIDISGESRQTAQIPAPAKHYSKPPSSQVTATSAPACQELHEPAPVFPSKTAPTFGGATGWRKSKSPLEELFAQREARNQRLHHIYLGWKPSKAFYELLAKHNIDRPFADQCLDEFVLYWLEKDRKETSWDQKFLAWVKRAWLNEENKQQALSKREENVINHENSETNRRTNRKRIADAVMDIKNIDW